MVSFVAAYVIRSSSPMTDDRTPSSGVFVVFESLLSCSARTLQRDSKNCVANFLRALPYLE
jgi:hypothetical protein